MISVIIPCYNVEDYIERCIDSILNQTIVEQLEIICIDDGSTDKTYNILKKYEELFDNIFLVKQKNQGQSAARNAGVKIAKEKYIGFIDSDDWINIDYYENMLNDIMKCDSDIVFCNMQTVYETGLIDPTNSRNYSIDQFKYILLDQYGRKEVIKSFLMDRVSVSPCNKLIKRDLIIDNNIAFRNGYYNEDMEYTFDLLMVSNSISKVNNSIYSYWQREGSTTKTADHRVLDMLFIVDQIKAKINKAFGNSDFSYELIYFELFFSIYLTLTRLRTCKDIDKKNLVLTVCRKLDQISFWQIYHSTEHPVKRRLVFFISKYLKKITAYII